MSKLSMIFAASLIALPVWANDLHSAEPGATCPIPPSSLQLFELLNPNRQLAPRNQCGDACVVPLEDLDKPRASYPEPALTG